MAVPLEITKMPVKNITDIQTEIRPKMFTDFFMIFSSFLLMKLMKKMRPTFYEKIYHPLSLILAY